MGLREDIIQGIREWLKAGLGLTDEQVRPADALFNEDLRPELSYLTVNMRGFRQLGYTEEALAWDDGDEELSTVTRSERIALVSLNGYGADALDWLTGATLLAHHWDANEALSGADLAFPLFGEIRDLAQVVDTDWEERWQVDLEVGISVDSDPVVTVPAEHYIIDITLQKEPIAEDDAEALTIDLDYPPDP